MAGKEEEGISLLLEGLQFAPPTGEHCCEIGEYFYEKGQWEQAIFWYENALHAERRTEQGAFVQEECYGFLPCIRLCVCYGRLGEWEMAKMKWQGYSDRRMHRCGRIGSILRKEHKKSSRKEDYDCKHVKVPGGRRKEISS